MLEYIRRLLASRKFQAMMLAVLAAITAWVAGEVEPASALYTIVMAVSAYILGVAGEDGLAKLGGLK